MTYPALTACYAGAFGLLYMILSFWVIAGRATGKVHHGDGGNEQLQRRIRAHGNFSEYVPIALLLSALLEMGGMTSGTTHTLLGVLFIARILHPIGMHMPVASKAQYLTRAPSVVATLGVIGTQSILLLRHALT